MKTLSNLAAMASILFITFIASPLTSSFTQEASAQEVSAPNVVAPAQPATATTASGTAGAVGQPGVQSAVQPAPGGLFGSPIIMMVVMLGVMYFLMIRPQQKRMKQQQELHKGLKSGDEVITSSGIIGTITGMSDKVVTLEISRNVQMKILKSQVNTVVKGPITEIQA